MAPSTHTNPFSLEGRIALVTGATRGLGAAFARSLADAGATVAVNGRDVAAVAAVVDEITARGGRAVPMPGDVSVRGGATALVDRTVETCGRLDILVNNAGLSRPSIIWDSPDEDWDAVLATNLTAVHEAIRAAARHMKVQRSGRIVNLTSAGGIDGSPGQANYGAAKAGVIGLTKSAALQLGRYGITVNAISPLAKTAMSSLVIDTDEKWQAAAARVPLRRIATPDEIGPSVVFLASDAGSYTTGHVLLVDGGTSM